METFINARNDRRKEEERREEERREEKRREKTHFLSVTEVEEKEEKNND